MTSQAESIRTARLFESYVKFIWPVHRLFVLKYLSKRCYSCSASEKMIKLDTAGLCEACKSERGTPHTKSSARDGAYEIRLTDILRQHQGAGPHQYDALGLFSGGKDSTYMLHRIRSEFPALRILAYTIDNGFMSSVAKDNVEEMLRKLKIDHIFVRPSPIFHKTLFRYCLTHLNAEGGYGTLDFSDGEFMLDTARNIAAEKRIPLILCGYSKYQVQNGLKIFDFESPRVKELSNRTETAGLRLSDIFSGEDLRRWWRGEAWPQDQVAKLLFPLYAWDLEESEIKRRIADWGLLKKKEYSPIVTNHQLIPVIAVVDVHRFGYSSFEAEFCRMIREGKAIRSDWRGTFEFLEYTAKSGLFVKKLIIDLLADLELKPNDVGVRFK